MRLRSILFVVSLLACLALTTSYSPDSSQYHMDQSKECLALADNSKRLHNPTDGAIIKAWSQSEHNPLSTCIMTFSAYQGYAIRFKLGKYTSNYIKDCGVRLEIHSGRERNGTSMIKSYGCGDSMHSSLFQYTNSKYITVHIANNGNFTSFDFNIYITNYDPAKTRPTKLTTRREMLAAKAMSVKLTTTSPGIPKTFYYNMDDIKQCTYWYSRRFSTTDDVAYVKAWSTPNPRIPLSGGCKIKLASYGFNGIKLQFQTKEPNYIGNCGVTLNIYSGLIANRSHLLKSYGCKDMNSLTDAYYYRKSYYILMELINLQNSSDYDFTLQVRSYDPLQDQRYPTKLQIVGIAVGSTFSLILLIVTLIRLRYLLRKRRRRLHQSNEAGVSLDNS